MKYVFFGLVGVALLLGGVVLWTSLTPPNTEHMAIKESPSNSQQVVYIHDDSYNDFFMLMWLSNMHMGVYGYWNPYIYQRSYVVEHYHYYPTSTPQSAKPKSTTKPVVSKTAPSKPAPVTAPKPKPAPPPPPKPKGK